MHFNTLLMQLRVRALGSIGLVAALLGYISKSGAGQPVQWALLAYAMLALFLIWFVIFLIDVFYYNKLLLGAVSATIELEKSKEETINIQFSSQVKNYIEGNGQKFTSLWPIHGFYIVVGFLLLSSCVYSFFRLYWNA